jgi:hypothetical protein
VTSVSADHDHVPPDFVPTVTTGNETSSSPTATHVVAVGQLTPLRTPPPCVSGATIVDDVHVQLPPDSVPIATMACLGELLSSPTATHDVLLGQLTP